MKRLALTLAMAAALLTGHVSRPVEAPRVPSDIITQEA